MKTVVITILSDSIENAIWLLDFANHNIQRDKDIGGISEFGCPEGVLGMKVLEGQWTISADRPIDIFAGVREDNNARATDSGDTVSRG